MAEKYRQRISDDLQVSCVEINSKLVSAQNRKRLYWTNIPFQTPIDNGIRLKDIVGDYAGIWVYPRGYNKGGVQSYNGFSPCITTSSWEHNFKLALNDGSIRKFTIDEIERMQTLDVGYTAANNISTAKRIKTIGNSWTVDVIAHILRGMKNDNPI